MSGLFGSDDTPVVQAVPAPPSRSDADVRAAALRERQRRAAAAGRESTIVNMLGATGVDEDNSPNVKRLLGTA